MLDAIIFKRRNRLKKHFVNVSNVLLYGYRTVSDAAKITYQVIDGFDWESKDTGDSKGFVFPAVETLAQIRNTTVRTIQRHIKELEEAKLLTRQRRRYKPSILFIEEIAEEEAHTYLARFVDTPIKNAEGGEPEKSRNDKNVVSQPTAETTKMSVVYKKEKEALKEHEISVNGVVKGGEKSVLQQLPDLGDPPEKAAYIAEHVILAALGDKQSRRFYELVAAKIPEAVIREVLSAIRVDGAESPAKLFTYKMQRYALGRSGLDSQTKTLGVSRKRGKVTAYT